MVKQILEEIERAKASLQSWIEQEREATDQIRLNRGYLQGLQKALELINTEEAPAEPVRDEEPVV